MNGQEILHTARLEGVYGAMRKLQATHDTFETRCIGSGKCCQIGLMIPLAECWNIAQNIQREFFIHAEDKGYEYANQWYDSLVNKLKAALHNPSWNPETWDQDDKCAFYDNGCTIYEFRPLVCRAYGVIAPAQEKCPRKRLEGGGHELIRDDEVERIIAEFDSLIAAWGTDRPDLDYTVYLPIGVLRFLLSDKEIQELVTITDAKFGAVEKGYTHRLHKDKWNYENEIPVSVRSK